MKKILSTVVLLTVIATPALAGTQHKPVARADAWSAYASAPQTYGANSPALTGGGSYGYNANEAQQILNR